MSQEELPWFESSEAATKHAIEVSGRPLKAVGSALWPDKSPDAARTALANALNENRPERLTADQHIFVATFVKQYHWLHYVAHQCSHSRPVLQTPAAKAAELQVALFAKAAEFKGLIAQIEQLQSYQAGAV